MAGVTLTIGYEDGISVALRAKRDRLASPRPLLDRIGALLESSTIERFDAQQSPAGEAWKPSFRAIRENGKTLIDSSHLRNSMTHVADDQAVEVGTNVIYAGTHQEGAIIASKSGGRLGFKLADGSFRSPERVVIPARPFLGLSAEDRVAIEDEIVAYVDLEGGA